MSSETAPFKTFSSRLIGGSDVSPPSFVGRNAAVTLLSLLFLTGIGLCFIRGTARGDIPSQPVAHWSFDRGPRDVSGNGHDGTFKGNAHVGGPARSGSGALVLDGRGDYMALEDSREINMAEEMPRRTVSVWFRAENVNVAGRKQIIWNEGGYDRGLNIYLYDGRLYVRGWNEPDEESGWSGSWISTEQVESGTWHHVALVLDGGPRTRPDALKGYLDGELIGSKEGSQLWLHHGNPSPGAIMNATKFHDTGDEQGTGIHGFSGLIDELRLYNRVLSASDVRSLAKEEGRAVAEPGSPDPGAGRSGAGSTGSGGSDTGQTATGIPEREKHRTGHFQLTVPGYDPGMLRDLVKMIGTGGRGRSIEALKKMVSIVEENGYKYAQVRGEPIEYEVDVPDRYDPEVPHGIMVFIASNKTGRIPGSFRSVLGNYNLIGIGANDAGNKTSTLKRHPAAVQAVQVLKRRYNIDEDRIYVSGMSGGGRVCSMVMIMNSPTFDGGFPMCGTNSLTSWKNPDRGRLRHAARKDRFVFYTGKNDPNRESVKSVANNYRKKGFRYVKYLEDSNAGHEVASTDYVRKAIEYLDDPTRTGSTPGGSDQPRPGTEKPGGESDGSGTSTGQGGNRGQAGSQGQETGEEQGQKPQRPPLGTILNEPGAVKGNRPWENAWQLQTPHFNIRSNISKEATREIGYVMEALYKNFNQLLNASLRSRVDVLVPKNRQGFDQIKRMPGQVRGYFTTRDGGKIVTYYHPGEIHHTTATLLHEGTHLIVMSTLRFRPLDIWINEGLAVYFEASKFERTDMTIGMKPKGRLRVAKQLVKSGQYVPIRKLIRLKQRQFTALHYAQAWSLVHYLVHAHDNKFVNKLDQYIISFKNYPDVSPTRRFRKFFPISFDELEKDWKRYVRELSLTGEDVVRIGTESQK